MKERVVQPQAVIERIEVDQGRRYCHPERWTTPSNKAYYPYQNERQLVTSGGPGTWLCSVCLLAIKARVYNQIKRIYSLCRRWWFPNDQSELAILNIYKVPIQGRYAQQPLSWNKLKVSGESHFYDGQIKSVFDSFRFPIDG